MSVPTILHADDFVLVVDKPAGVLTVPDRYDAQAPHLVGMLQKRFGELFIVHRLDKETSGVVCLARCAESHRVLSLAFEERKVEKIYVAIVKGEIRLDHDTVDLPIGAHPRIKGLMQIDQEEGKFATTSVAVRERFRGFSLVELRPLTGRTHQIRVHMQAYGHPLAVDPKYGGAEALYLSSLKRKFRQKPDEVERPLIDRVTLHAEELRFPIPPANDVISVQAPLPKDLRALLNQLRKL